MPYLENKTRREMLNNGDIPKNAAELNYKIFRYIKICRDQRVEYDTLIILTYVREFVGDTPNYQKYNDLIGCLVCCYKEILRRFALKIRFLLEVIDIYQMSIEKYEIKKLRDNGDVK